MSTELVWSSLIFCSLGVLAILWTAALALEDNQLRIALSIAFPTLVAIVCLLCGRAWNPYVRLAASSLVLLYVFKGSSLLRQPRSVVQAMNPLGLAYFSLFWPGIDSTPFQNKPTSTIEDHQRFAGGLVRAICGLAVFLVTAMLVRSHNLAEWLGIFAILLTCHLGFSNALTEVTCAIGWKVEPLFDSPHRSASLSKFWSHRWNRPFVELNRIFFMPWLVRRFGLRRAVFSAFLISGVLHELAISYPAQAGWGGPFLYFAIQGMFVLGERRLPFRGPIWVALVVLSPLPILFHAPFRSQIILPFIQWTHAHLAAFHTHQVVSILLTALGVSHFVILAASFQVPTRLRWREELPRLSSLNQKLMWTYGSFTVLTIVTWGVLTLVLRNDILAGTTAGLSINIAIFAFWGFRLLTDFFYFRSSDWPVGPFMQIGHVLLNSLFFFVFIGYGVVLLHHFFGYNGLLEKAMAFTRFF